ncbi:hypothetical protein BDF22DRAFT_324525 [Syncephalis plumigaleata]|nr:hypothetical protein BDF22DRAFT_324525 [Syncephalis plumigaleata]
MYVCMYVCIGPLGSHLIHMQLNRVKQRESHASQRLAVNVPWHPPRSVAIPSARITPMMTSTTIYDHDDYANSTIVSQPFTAREWTNANDQCRFSLSSSMSSLSVTPAPASATMFSAVESPTSIIAYPLPSLNLTSTGISVDDYTNDNSNHIDTSITMDNNCKYKAPSNNHSISSRSSNRNNRNTRRTSMPGIRHKPSYSFQTDSCVELNDKKYSIVYVGNSGATSLRLSKSLNPNAMKQHEASSIITTTGSHTPVKMMFPSLFSTAIGLTVNASRETCDTNNSSETKYQYRASSPSCISNDSPINNNRHEYHYRLAEYTTKRCSSSSF